MDEIVVFFCLLEGNGFVDDKSVMWGESFFGNWVLRIVVVLKWKSRMEYNR